VRSVAKRTICDLDQETDGRTLTTVEERVERDQVWGYRW